mmetsp:Transcript_55563/g.140615  ORF Transcript_55563/g.140615 Transcript_55563/m.140615 type:complete len:423 (-) Transcript_55563:525-1793(-)
MDQDHAEPCSDAESVGSSLIGMSRTTGPSQDSSPWDFSGSLIQQLDTVGTTSLCALQPTPPPAGCGGIDIGKADDNGSGELEGEIREDRSPQCSLRGVAGVPRLHRGTCLGVGATTGAVAAIPSGEYHAEPQDCCAVSAAATGARPGGGCCSWPGDNAVAGTVRPAAGGGGDVEKERRAPVAGRCSGAPPRSGGGTFGLPNGSGGTAGLRGAVGLWPLSVLGTSCVPPPSGFPSSMLLRHRPSGGGSGCGGTGVLLHGTATLGDSSATAGGVEGRASNREASAFNICDRVLDLGSAKNLRKFDVASHNSCTKPCKCRTWGLLLSTNLCIGSIPRACGSPEVDKGKLAGLSSIAAICTLSLSTPSSITLGSQSFASLHRRRSSARVARKSAPLVASNCCTSRPKALPTCALPFGGGVDEMHLV